MEVWAKLTFDPVVRVSPSCSVLNIIREAVHTEPEVLPEHDSSHGIDGKEQPDDEGIAVEQHPAVL